LTKNWIWRNREGHSRRTHHNSAANLQSSIYDLNDAERTSTFYNFARQNRNEDVALRQDIVNMEANSNSMCDIKPRDGTASLIRRAKLIVWDESSMTSKSIFETVDRSIRDILKDEDSAFGNTPFGGRLFVFSGDFRQVLPVIPRAGRSQIVQECINISRLWSKAEVLKLRVNMKVQTALQLNNPQLAIELQ
jgi:hypothetical protein